MTTKFRSELVPTRTTLWDMEAALKRAYELLDDNEGAHEPEAEAVVKSYLEAALEKRDRVTSFLRVTRAWEDHLDLEIARLKAKRDRAARVRERLEGYVLAVMEALGVRRLEGATTTLAIRKNPPAVKVDEDAQVPEYYVRTRVLREPDKTALKAALERGEQIRGVRLAQGERLDYAR